jgi:uncharacterized Zn finger protein
MARYYDGWAAYVPVAERRRRAARQMEKLRKKGHPVAPVVIEGRTIAATFWGKAWCENLESYRDYENRLPRGRTYVRNGSVVDLQIAPSEVTAMVSGSSMYKVKVSIALLAKKQWASICKDCAGGIDSLVELLQGRFSKGVMERICRQGSGLFPKPAEIRFSCNCEDHALMCKHVAAVLYGVGARLDERPELLFRLRAVDETELLARVDATLPMAKHLPSPERMLDAEDVSVLFGLDMDADERAVAKADDAPPAEQKPVRAERTVYPKRSGTMHKAVVRRGIGLPTQDQAANGARIKLNSNREASARKRTPRELPEKVKRSGAARKPETTDA